MLQPLASRHLPVWSYWERERLLLEVILILCLYLAFSNNV